MSFYDIRPDEKLKRWLPLIAVVVLLSACSWIANIVKLVNHTGPLDVEAVVRIVGIGFAPLGVVMGVL